MKKPDKSKKLQSVIFRSFLKSFTTTAFKSKCGHEVIKTLNIEATSLRYYGKQLL